MENATYDPTLELINQEGPDPSHTAYASTALSQAETAPRSAPYGDPEISEKNLNLSAESTPFPNLIEIVPDSIVAAEMGECPHCLPLHWPRKAPAP